MKKIISVLLCIAMMFTFLTVISFAAEGATDGSETIWDMIVNLLSNAKWDEILKILVVTVQTFLRIIGAAA